jgi:hypothetical protein
MFCEGPLICGQIGWGARNGGIKDDFKFGLQQMEKQMSSLGGERVKF